MEAHPHVDAIGHETKDANVRAIVLTLACLAVGAALVCVLVYGIFRYLADHPLTTEPPNPMAETAGREIPPQPRIEEHPAIELKDLHAQEDKILSTYGWTDKRTGVVRIPIDRAMDLQFQRGFPTRPAGQSANPASKSVSPASKSVNPASKSVNPASKSVNPASKSVNKEGKQ